MADHPKVTFARAPWSMLAARDLAQIADVTEHDLRVFACEVSAENWQLLEIFADGERIGCLVWSVEQQGDRFALIINAAYARPVPGADVTGAMLDMFRATAQHVGACAIRCWTERAGLVRKLEQAGATRKYVMEIAT